MEVFIKLHLASHFGLYLKKRLKFSKKFFHNFFDLGLHFDFCENGSYSTLAAKARFFTRKNLSEKHFNKLKKCDKVFFNIYTLKQK